jgi:ABC-type uncharacterized transport system involved in gliding motility auxiliary subunit
MFELRSIFKYLFIPGIILAIAGLVAGLITQIWSPFYIGLLIAGVVILIVWLGFIFVSAQGFWRRRSTQIGTNAILATLSLIAILCLVNFLAIRYSTRIDLTENQLLTLAPQSQEIVKNLKQPLKVWLFDKEPNQIDKALLENYRRYSKNFAFEYVDPDLKPGLAEQFQIKSLGDVYLEYGNKKQLVQTLVNFQQREPLSEIQLTNGIEKIQRDRVQKIYFLQGHGEASLNTSEESGLSLAVSSLEDKGYTVESLNLVEHSAIPEDASAIVIAGAKRKFFEPEVKLLKEYSERGGSLFLLLDPDTNLGLEPLLKEWGIQLEKRVIIDVSGKGNILGYGPATPIITNYGDHPITKDFSNEFSLYPFAQPIATVKVENVTAVALLITDNQMWAESDLKSEQIEFDETKDLPGPFDLGVALTRKLSETASKTEASKEETTTPAPSPSPESDREKIESTKTPIPSPSPLNENRYKNQPKKSESRMVVIGNSSFASDSLFQDPRVLNGDIFLNSVQWLASDDQQTLSIRPKEAKNRRINLTPLQAGMIGWMSLVIMPLLGLILAGVTWWRRR